jgi:glycosyltransferase involved in cell wall biosynthesis
MSSTTEPRRKSISVVVPVYENELTIPFLFERLKELENNLKKLQVDLELIFVDDGSTDNSWRELLEIKKLREETTIIKLSRNFGSIKCSRAGLNYVTGDAFAILASDLQDPPELIVEMVTHWLRGSKFVICERNSRQDPFVTKIFAKIYYKILRAMALPTYPVGGFDLALLDSSALKIISQSSKSAYTPVLMWWLGYEPTVIRYERQERLHGKSKWTFIKKLNAFLDIILGFSVRPIRAITAIGISFATLSAIFGSVILVNALLGQVVVPGYASLATLISFVLSLIIVMLGIIGEYLWRIFEETNNRPDSVIDKFL